MNYVLELMYSFIDKPTHHLLDVLTVYRVLDEVFFITSEVFLGRRWGGFGKLVHIVGHERVAPTL
jgi:hypothetical protein